MADRKRIEFIVPEHVHETWARNAAQAGMSLSAYIKMNMPGEYGTPAIPRTQENLQIAELIAVLQKIHADLAAIGNNINQIAKVLNSHVKHGGQLPTQLNVVGQWTALDKMIRETAKEIRTLGQKMIRG
jgi:2,4-dienoyl-CoA reductase-like NADH-dependent reductase (Old Yellow Enzyme family)